MMLIVILLLFLPTLLLGQTTQFLITPTTFQILSDGFDKIENNEDKIIEINKELEKNPDVITGQSLTNIKTYLEVEVRHKKQGRNYFGYIHYPIYIKVGE